MTWSSETTMSDPFRNYDAWLEAPIQRFYNEQEAELEAWEAYCVTVNGYDPNDEPGTVDTILGPRPAPPRVPTVPVEASEPEHPDHAIYQAWLDLETAIQARADRLWAESEQFDYGPQFGEEEE